MGVDFDASEFLDKPDVLDAKVAHLARMVLKSRKLLAYTGAGLSTAAGIGDYASRAAESKVKRWDPAHGGGPHMEFLKECKPTDGHKVLAALGHTGYLTQWVNQNHDGLAQKATFPQELLNEIHGSWFDDRNPVVAMDGALRADLFQRLEDWEHQADVVLALGTTLSGLCADGLAEKAAARAAASGSGLGLVFVSLTRTRLDEHAALRIFAPIDKTLLLLSQKLKLALPTDADVVAASKRAAFFKRYALWYRDVHDVAHQRESKIQIMARAQPSNPTLEDMRYQVRLRRQARSAR